MSSISEDPFLEALFKKLSYDDSLVVPPGDDCAALSVGGNQLLLISVDQLSEDVHYFSQTSKDPTPPGLAGRKLLARGLSDIAAMGGKATYALIAISSGPGYNREWLEDFMEGVLTLAKEFEITIIGGDLAAANANVSSATVLGWGQPQNICLRSQAQAGDSIWVTGEFGASLKTEKHLLFTPRLNESKWLVEKGYTQAMIDVSDGLLKDLSRLCRASHLRAILNENAVPCTRIENCEVPLLNAFVDGEDYELLFSVPQGKCNELIREWPFLTRLTNIGHFIQQKMKALIANEQGENLQVKYGSGFDHFSRV